MGGSFFSTVALCSYCDILNMFEIIYQKLYIEFNVNNLNIYQLQTRLINMNKKLDRAYYDTLEVRKDADADEIKKAYKKASLKAHPDKGGSTEMF